MAHVQKIVPNLWFADAAEEAVNFYTSIFPNSSIGKISRYTKDGFENHQRPPGSVMTIAFSLAGQHFLALNGGPVFTFTEAVSFVVNCDTQEEIDHYWNVLTTGGDPTAQVCGWCKDKFGVSWQVVPTKLADLMTQGNPESSGRVMLALMKMKKLDIAALEEAARQ